MLTKCFYLNCIFKFFNVIQKTTKHLNTGLRGSLNSDLKVWSVLKTHVHSLEINGFTLRKHVITPTGEWDSGNLLTKRWKFWKKVFRLDLKQENTPNRTGFILWFFEEKCIDWPIWKGWTVIIQCLSPFLRLHRGAKSSKKYVVSIFDDR